MMTLAIVAVAGCIGVASAAGAASYDLVGTHAIVNFATDPSGTTASVSYGSYNGSTCALTSTQTASCATVKVGSVKQRAVRICGWRAHALGAGSRGACSVRLALSYPPVSVCSSNSFAIAGSRRRTALANARRYSASVSSSSVAA